MEIVSIPTLYEMDYTLDTLSLFHVRVTPAGDEHPCADRETSALVFSGGGRFSYTYDGGGFLFAPGDMVYLPTHGRYRHVCLGGVPGEDGRLRTDSYVLNFRIRDPSGREVCLSDTPLHFAGGGTAHMQRVQSLLDEYFAPLVQPAEFRAQAYGLLSAVVRRLYRNRMPGNSRYRALQAAFALLDTTPPAALSVEDLLHAGYLSATRFRVLFREYTGYAPGEYLRRRVLDTADRLLRNTDLSIGEISRQLGFDSPAYFGKFYKKYTGYPPSRVRGSGSAASPRAVAAPYPAAAAGERQP